jgi:hypothetical protein
MEYQSGDSILVRYGLSLARPPSRGIPTLFLVIARQMRVGRFCLRDRVGSTCVAGSVALLMARIITGRSAAWLNSDSKTSNVPTQELLVEQSLLFLLPSFCVGA